MSLSVKELRDIAAEGDWDELAGAATPAEVLAALGPEQALAAAHGASHNTWNSQSVTRYGVALYTHLQQAAPAAWQADWRHELALAEAADRVFAFDVRNQALQRALAAHTPPRLEVAWQLAETLYAPEQAPLSLAQVTDLLRAALDGSEPAFALAAARLAWLYEQQGQGEQAATWRAREAELRAAGAVEPAA